MAQYKTSDGKIIVLHQFKKTEKVLLKKTFEKEKTKIKYVRDFIFNFIFFKENKKK